LQQEHPYFSFQNDFFHTCLVLENKFIKPFDFVNSAVGKIILIGYLRLRGKAISSFGVFINSVLWHQTTNNMKPLLTIILSVLLISCGPSQVEKDYIKNLEEKNKALEKELQEIKNNTDSSYTAGETNQKAKISKDYFTIGSTEDEVLKVMGDPTSIFVVGYLKKYSYGGSTVDFRHGKVESHYNDGNLKVQVKIRK